MAFMAYPTRGMDDEDLNAAPDGAFTFGGGGGLLSGGGGGMGGLLGGMGQKFSDSSNLMSALGMALMSGSSNNPFENMNSALVSGGTMDARERKARDEKQQQALARQAMVMSLTKGGMAPEEANLMAASPQAVSTWMQQERNKKTDANDARDFSFRQTEAQRAQSNADRQFGLSEQTPAQRAARDLQVQPGTPEYKTFMDSQYKQGPTLHERDPEKDLTRETPGGGYEVLRPAQKRNPAVKISEEVAQREAEAARMGLKKDSPAYQSYTLTGKMPREDAQPLSASDKKMIAAAEDEIVTLDNTIATLNQAKKLNPLTYTGTGAGALGKIGTSVPGAGYILDENKAKATREFGQLMSMEAIKSMSQTLKGATTDREMARFMEILGDPTTPPELRGRTIDRMLTMAERQKKLNEERARDMRGQTYFKPEHGGATAPPPGKSGGGLPSGTYNWTGNGLVPMQGLE